MFYPKSFKEKVNALLPDNATVINAVENYDVSVGKMLLELSNMHFTATDILNAACNRKLEKLVARAKHQQKIAELYEEWMNLFEDWKQYCVTHDLKAE